jgi:hypothetical protein
MVKDNRLKVIIIFLEDVDKWMYGHLIGKPGIDKFQPATVGLSL